MQLLTASETDLYRRKSPRFAAPNLKTTSIGNSHSFLGPHYSSQLSSHCTGYGLDILRSQFAPQVPPSRDHVPGYHFVDPQHFRTSTIIQSDVQLGSKEGTVYVAPSSHRPAISDSDKASSSIHTDSHPDKIHHDAAGCILKPEENSLNLLISTKLSNLGSSLHSKTCQDYHSSNNPKHSNGDVEDARVQQTNKPTYRFVSIPSISHKPLLDLVFRDMGNGISQAFQRKDLPPLLPSDLSGAFEGGRNGPAEGYDYFVESDQEIRKSNDSYLGKS